MLMTQLVVPYNIFLENALSQSSLYYSDSKVCSSASKQLKQSVPARQDTLYHRVKTVCSSASRQSDTYRWLQEQSPKSARPLHSAERNFIPQEECKIAFA